MSTSLWPTAGSGTSCSQIPGSARALTSAFILPSMDDAEIAPRGLKRANDLIELLAGVRGADLGANPRFSMGNDRKRESDDVGALLLNPLREVDRQRRLAQHNRDDGMLAGKQIESQALHLRAVVAGVRVQPLAQIGRTFQQIEHPQRCRGDRRRDAVREQIGARPLAQPADDFLARGDVAAAGAAESLAES